MTSHSETLMVRSRSPRPKGQRLNNDWFLNREFFNTPKGLHDARKLAKDLADVFNREVSIYLHIQDHEYKKVALK